jgi:tripartite-type tricarboxylate transporter receptor subunit TctC
VRKVSRDLDRVLMDREISGRLRDFGIYTDGAGTPEATAKFLAAERVRWERAVRDLGIQPE